MALGETAKLIASLELQDKFSKTADSANRKLGGLESATGKAGKAMGFFGHTVSTALGFGLSVAVSRGIGLLQSSISEGIAGAQKLEDVMTATNTVLKSTKDASGQTAAGIRQMSSDFEDMNALIDDKVIQSAQNMLLTFTGIGPKAFKPATQAILDMNTAMGGGEAGLQNVAIQVGKALQDPIRGATALRRVGVALTVEQQKQIKTLVKQNDLYGAQQIILKELGTEFGGRFAAQGKTAAAQMAAFHDSVDDLKISLAQGLLPGLGNVAKALSKLFRDPATVTAVSNFGKKISEFLSPSNIQTGVGLIKDAFGKVAAFAKAVPWQAIGDALKLGGVGAKAILDAFLGAPQWLQTAVITGWGLNKLTGGGLGKIAIDLVAGLIKGRSCSARRHAGQRRDSWRTGGWSRRRRGSGRDRGQGPHRSGCKCCSALPLRRIGAGSPGRQRCRPSLRPRPRANAFDRPQVRQLAAQAGIAAIDETLP